MASKRSKRGQNGSDNDTDLESLRDSFEEEEKSFSESESSYSSDEKRKKVIRTTFTLLKSFLSIHILYNFRNHRRKSHRATLNHHQNLKSQKKQYQVMTMMMTTMKMIIWQVKKSQNLNQTMKI